jgi:hypothetical protein
MPPVDVPVEVTVSELTGVASDDAPAVLATGRSGVTALFVSMATRHPEGRDAEYLRWHCFDHRPEQHRLAALRSSLRLVSTPACRAARMVGDARFDRVDHVMTYFFSDVAGLAGFDDLSAALRAAGRTPYVLPPVERGVFGVGGAVAAPRVKVGAEVLPWWPASGVMLLVERGDADDPAPLIEVDGVGGVWWGRAKPVDARYSTAAPDTQITYCFLDGDPPEVAARLGPAVERRRASGLELLLAAPFHVVLAHDVTRHLP